MPIGNLDCFVSCSMLRYLIYIAIGSCLGVYIMGVFPFFDSPDITLLAHLVVSSISGMASAPESFDLSSSLPSSPLSQLSPSPTPQSAFSTTELRQSDAKPLGVTFREMPSERGPPLSKNVQALHLIPQGRDTWCVLEVGTAAGRRSTTAWVHSLDRLCGTSYRSWTHSFPMEA